MNKLEDLEFLNSSEEINKLKLLENPQKIKEYFEKNNIDISLEKAEEIKGLIYTINELDKKDPQKINELYESLSNNLNSEILEAAGGDKTINNIVKVGVAALVLMGGCKVAWDVNNECQRKTKPFSFIPDTITNFGSNSGLTSNNKGMYDTFIGAVADGIIKLGKRKKFK